MEVFTRRWISNAIGKRVVGGSIPYAIIVSFIVVMLCSALILNSLLSNRLLNKEIVNTKLDDGIVSAVRVLGYIGSSMAYNTEQVLCPFGDSSQTVLVNKRVWGAYDLYKLRVSIGAHSVCRHAMFGEVYEPLAIWLAMGNEYLFVTGNTRIVGDCYVPGGLVREGRIGDVGFSGEERVVGGAFKSEGELPSVNTALLTNLEQYSTTIAVEDSVVTYHDNLGVSIAVVNSFQNKTLYVVSENPITLKNITFRGNIVVRTSKAVTISSSAVLEDVIIVAASVNVNDNFSGTIQIVATDSVSIGQNCELKYPSFVSSVGYRDQRIHIKSGAIIHGGVLVFQKGNQNMSNASVEIDEKALVRGVVYSNSTVEVNGTIHGSVYCNEFLMNKGYSLYRNYLMDCEINSTLLGNNFVSPILMRGTRHNGFVGWVN